MDLCDRNGYDNWNITQMFHLFWPNVKFIQFGDECTVWPYTDVGYYTAKGSSELLYWCHQMLNFHRLHSTTIHCGVSCHFETSAQNYPERLCPLLVPQIHVNVCVFCPWVPNFIPLRPMTTRIWGTGHFRTNASIEPTLHVQGQIYAIYIITSVHEPPNFTLCFWAKCTKWPQNDLE